MAFSDIKHIVFTGFAGAALMLSGCATNDTAPSGYPQQQQQKSAQQEYERDEIVDAISVHMGVTAESAATVIERIFKDQGRPVGYITGEEGGGALTVGVRYGKGTLWMKNGANRKVYWQGPTIGFDVGADASKVFTLVYALDDPDMVYRRYPGVDGSAYLVAGMAVNYQRANGITLAPIRTGVGLRLGAKVGYTAYSKKRKYIPL